MKYLLLPPSEGKREGGTGSWLPNTGMFGALGAARSEVSDAVRMFARRASRAELEKFFGVGGQHLERAVAAAQTGFISEPVLPAAERYSGVVWEHLGIATLRAADRRWCVQHVVVVSGLLGLVAGVDPVPDYRLKMSARLPTLGVLSQWWRPRLLDAARSAFARAEVVDALPNEHASAFAPEAVARRVVRLRFMSATGANAAGHAAKAAKGLAARAIVEQRSAVTETVCSAMQLPGFRYSEVEHVSKRPVVREVRMRAAQ